MPTKRKYKCATGPMKGSNLWLNPKNGGFEFNETGWLVFGELVGRYVESPIDGQLYWEKKSDECPI